MTSFGGELLGGHGFSLIPSKSLHAIIFANPRLLFPTSLWWHTLGSKVGLPYLSGKRRRRGGICMLVSILWVGRRR